MRYLLDANVLVAMSLPDHVHHDPAHAWLAARPDIHLATCPTTQGALLRVALQRGATVEEARALLDALFAMDRHEFWPDDLPYTKARLRGVVGHRQITDAYLASLARAHGGRLATLDGGLAVLHDDVAELIPVV